MAAASLFFLATVLLVAQHCAATVTVRIPTMNCVSIGGRGHQAALAPASDYWRHCRSC